MTNQLEQIRELAEKWKNRRPTEGDNESNANELLAILDASQGYVCVPVEVEKDAKRWKFCEVYGFPVREQSHGYMLGSFMRHETPAAAVDYCMLAASKETNRE